MQRKSKQTTPRWTAAAVLGLFAAAGVAQAVEFDEKIQSPRVTNVADLRTEAQAFAAQVAQLQSASPLALVTSQALASARFDLQWKINQAIDSHEPLGDLSAIGLEALGDGAYRIDLSKNPQWRTLEDAMLGILPQSNWGVLGPELVARGFREEDVKTLQSAVGAHDAEIDAAQATLPMAISFSRLVKKLDKIKRPVSDNLVLSYLYQRNKAAADVRRRWATQVLDSLDAQRSRILVSYFGEYSTRAIWAPSDRRAGIADVLSTMRRPDFERIVIEESRGVAP